MHTVDSRLKPGERPLVVFSEVDNRVRHQFCVLVGVPVTAYQQRFHLRFYSCHRVRDQGLALPGYQPLVTAPGATAASAGEYESGDRLGRVVLQIWMTARI